MMAILATFFFGIIAVFMFLGALGYPVGEFFFGGKHRILPTNLRVLSGVIFLVQFLTVFILLQAGGIISYGLDPMIARTICYIFAALLSFFAVTNFLSKSKKEKYLMTALSALSAIFFLTTAMAG